MEHLLVQLCVYRPIQLDGGDFGLWAGFMSPDAAPSNEDIITPLVPRNVLGRMEKQTGRDKDNAGKDLGYDACFTAEIYIYIFK